MTRFLSAPCRAVVIGSLLAANCRQIADDSSDTTDSYVDTPANTVVVITIDTVRPRVLHAEGRDWNVAPNMLSFFDESTWFDRAITPRGYTAVALASMLTGVYPRTHGVRNNDLIDAISQPTLAHRFGEGGYTTLGYAANKCQLMENGFDESVCGNLMNSSDTGLPTNQEDLDQVANDQLLLDSFTERVAQLEDDEPVFVWVHLNLPHSPYYPITPWIDEFHPDEYQGEIDTTEEMDLYLVTLDEQPFDDADRNWVEAVYASELRDTDERFQGFMDALEAVGRLDEAIVVLGADHGEELGDHNGYFYHGCSPYDSVMRVEYAIHAPGRLPRGVQVEAPISTIDIAPTVVELASAFSWGGDAEGVSLVTDLRDGAEPDHDVFFERSTGTAGVVRGAHKYILTPEGEYDECVPFEGNPDAAYAAEVEELYDISADPTELANLASSEPTKRSDLSAVVCAWVRDGDWVPEYQQEANPLLGWCDDSYPQ